MFYCFLHNIVMSFYQYSTSCLHDIMNQAKVFACKLKEIKARCGSQQHWLRMNMAMLCVSHLLKDVSQRLSSPFPLALVPPGMCLAGGGSMSTPVSQVLWCSTAPARVAGRCDPWRVEFAENQFIVARCYKMLCCKSFYNTVRLYVHAMPWPVPYWRTAAKSLGPFNPFTSHISWSILCRQRPCPPFESRGMDLSTKTDPFCCAVGAQPLKKNGSVLQYLASGLEITKEEDPKWMALHLAMFPARPAGRRNVFPESHKTFKLPEDYCKKHVLTNSVSSSAARPCRVIWRPTLAMNRFTPF